MRDRTEPGARKPPPAAPLQQEGIDRRTNPLWSRLAHANGRSIQPKLRAGAVDDPLEREADRVADTMVSGAAAPASIQRTCAACEEEELHRSPSELPAEDEEEKLQTKREAGTTPEVSPQTATRIDSLRGGGEALSPAARSYFEPRFGRDLSRVRVHTGGEAAIAARQISARAFTVGSDIAFGAGEYHPNTTEGRRLLAHELTHTVQQSAGPAPGAGIVQRARVRPHRPRRWRRGPRPSDFVQPILDRFEEILATVESSPSPYTQGTQTALLSVRLSMYMSLRKLRKLELSWAAKWHLQRITTLFVDELEDEVARSPEGDPDQEGNIREIERRWNRAYIKQLAKKLVEEHGKPPRDYPEPDGQWLA